MRANGQAEEADLSLDPTTGMLRIRQPLDRESRDKYVLSVEARNGGFVGYCQLELIVEDVNDNTPSFGTSSVRISVPESHPLHVPLYVARATDPDSTPSSPIRYVLGQNSNDLFGIEARTGELYLARRLDYETQQRHGLLIRALDGAGLSANLSLSVEVQDVNDNPPVFERNEYHVEVPEGARLDSQVRKIFITRPSREHLFAEKMRQGSPKKKAASEAGSGGGTRTRTLELEKETEG
ncbi:Protein dachsous [Ooceraea biroi]|uniref:Protein dachsous n=1 Tax=Ooceraea biroi TaxID=2015173 RepID=A0A026WAE4_OOCBI|nr:Protein dachsous [Ooceraea biroi]